MRILDDEERQLQLAALRGEMEKVREMVAREVGGSAAAAATLALPGVAARHDVALLEELLALGADPNARGWEHGRPALHMALAGGRGRDRERLAVLEPLLAAGADPEVVDHLDYTAVTLARARGRVRCHERMAPKARWPRELRTVDHLVVFDHEGVLGLYRPNEPHKVFYFEAGHWRERYGGTYTAAEALAKERGTLEAHEAGWFVPLLRRMAVGVTVGLGEIQGAARRATGGPLEVVRFARG